MHNEYTKLMSLALDQEATPAVVQRLNEHLRTCDACAATWQHWRTLDRRLAASPLLPAPEGFVDRMVARLDQVELRQRRARWLFSGLLAGWAALVGVAALCGGLVVAWLQGNMALLISWISVITQWISALFLLGRGAWAAVTSLGAPTLAGAIGLLACATCALGVTWLWLVPRGQGLFRMAVTSAR